MRIYELYCYVKKKLIKLIICIWVQVYLENSLSLASHFDIFLQIQVREMYLLIWKLRIYSIDNFLETLEFVSCRYWLIIE